MMDKMIDLINQGGTGEYDARQERGEAVALQWQEKGNHKIYGTADCAFAQFVDLEHSVGPAGFEVYQSNDGWECTFWHGNRGHRICKSQSLRLQAQAAAQRHADKIAESIIKITHPTPDAGRVAELEAECKRLREEVHAHASNEVDFAEQNAALEAQLAESREREGRMREALEECVCALEVCGKDYRATEIGRAALAAEKEGE